MDDAWQKANEFTDTPRSRLALGRIGVRPEELTMKPYQDFFVPSDPNPAKQRLRFTHYETRRQDKLEMVLKERAKVILEAKIKESKPATSKQRSFQSLQMMEQLLDKEAMRLEHELKQQLKYHQAVEADNEEQLDKEAKLRKKETTRDERKQVANAALLTKAKQVKMNHDSRQINADAGMKKITEEKDAKVATHLAEMLETEVRLRNFNEDKTKRGAMKSDELDKKRTEMADKFREIEEQREENGKYLMNKREKHLDDISKKQKEDATKKDLRHCDRHLRVLDVLEKKQQINRQDAFRLQKVQAESKNMLLRVETMLQLKDQMVAQRKKRLHAPKKSQAMSMKNMPVGPGQYDVNRERVLNEIPVTKISNANVAKGHVEFAENAVNKTKGIPPPGAYDPKLLKDGSLVEACVGTAVVFPKDVAGNFAEIASRATKGNPGPGKYSAKVEVFHPTIGAKIKQDYVPPHASDPPKWAEVNMVSPGPAMYRVDDFLRREELRKYQKNLPNLSSAMKMTRKNT
eukprot:GEMP01018471.1.p1 GENE.GEMP01018471.1~~GEMP01018471.1.p1  ORF type:complete len:518 (+),score=156.53 GEMP01018471.1:56-1609(+)